MIAGTPVTASPAASSLALPAGAQRACATPRSSRKRFWVSRSWITRSTPAPGRTGRKVSSSARISAGTCSVSRVITSTWAASWRAASGSSSAPTTTPSDTWAVGQRGLGSSTTMR
jgi:hypothetical protein